MKALVTGSAGFIGSHLAERLVELGYEVVGVDCFTDYYPRELKESNLENLRKDKNFSFVEGDLLNLDLRGIVRGVDYIFHQAAQAGVRSSWGKTFETYTNNNILATQKLLEAVKGSGLKRFVYASSSSVYGDSRSLPMKEGDRPEPVSPYGVSKLAGEHLSMLYWKNFGVPAVSLRYFTVYGPRQRPDMAFHKFIKNIMEGKEIRIYGSGEQTRDFTYIDDVVEANLLAAKKRVDGKVFNVGGGNRIGLKKTLNIMEDVVGKKAIVRNVNPQKGDVKDTYADTSKAKGLLGYNPRWDIRDGLEKEVEWLGQR